MRTITLNCLSGPLKGETFKLDGGPVFLFGRHHKAGCSLAADPAASHLHFLIDTSDRRVRIIDLGSTNGLVINDKHIGGKKGEPFTDFITLRSDDTILAGSSLFRITIVDSSTSAILQTTADESTQSDIPQSAPVPAELPKPTVNAPVSSSSARYHTRLSTGRYAPPILQENGLPAIPGFTLIEKIGEGGKGIIYRGVKDDSGAAAAIKILALSKQGTLRAMESFQREIEMTKRLDHPNIIRYLGDGFTGGAPYLAAEYVGGGTLVELTDSSQNKHLTVPQAVPLFIQLLEATAYLHGLGIVHRDITPKNVLLDLRRAGSMAAKLSDMGQASWISSGELSEYMPISGYREMPAYMPPEQLTDPVRAIPQSDVYSAGATFYYMMTGALMFDFTGKDAKEIVIEGKIIPLGQARPDLAPGIIHVISKALSHSPDDRYADGQAFLDEFRRALS